MSAVTDVSRATVSPRTATSWPVLGLLLVVMLGFSVYVVLAVSAPSPRAFSDELLYFDSAASIVDGDGLSTRGQEYRFGPAYPVVLAAILWIAPDRESAYELAKLLNALLFTLTAVPVFLLARRLLPPWTSVVAAGLSIAIPSSMYVSVVMTESLAYLSAVWALYAIALSVEKPTVLRQIATMGVILIAVGVRTQFLMLYAVYFLSLVLAAVLLPDRRAQPRAAAAALRPSLVAAGVGAVVLLVPTVFESGSPQQSVGPYSALWRAYEFDQVLKWLVYQIANLELYVGVVPLAVMPIVVTVLLRKCKRGSEREAAFLAVFTMTNLVFLLLAAAFNSTPFSGGLIHDRVVFYVVPLWVIVLMTWVTEGVPRPAFATALGALLAIALPLALPFSDFARDDGRLQFNAVTTTLWASIDTALEATGISGRLLLWVVVLILVLAVMVTPTARSALFPTVVLAVFLITAVLSWETAVRNSTFWNAVLPQATREWLDDRVSVGRVTLLVATAPCVGAISRDAFYLTEFFNSSVDGVVRVGRPVDSLPSTRVRVGRDGNVLLPSGRPLVADHLVAQPGIRLAGERVADGTRARLVLWKIGGTVRVPGVTSSAGVTAAACRARLDP